ncbi:MAG: hypothetical protein ABSC55_02865 [Syntrophorhabdales bacterium]
MRNWQISLPPSNAQLRVVASDEDYTKKESISRGRFFSFDANLEDTMVAAHNEFPLECRGNGDSTSVKLFEPSIDEEQIHFNYFDNTSDHIKN